MARKKKPVDMDVVYFTRAHNSLLRNVIDGLRRKKDVRLAERAQVGGKAVELCDRALLLLEANIKKGIIVTKPKRELECLKNVVASYREDWQKLAKEMGDA